MDENRRTWLIGGVVLAVLVVALGGYLLFRGGPKSTLTVRSIPGDLTLTLDGRPISANGEVKIKEGRHTLLAEREGFQSYSQPIQAVDGNPVEVKMYLYPNGPVGRAWEKVNPGPALEAEAEAGRQYDQLTKRLAQKYRCCRNCPTSARASRWSTARPSWTRTTPNSSASTSRSSVPRVGPRRSSGCVAMATTRRGTS
jgi:hypothetical protein